MTLLDDGDMRIIEVDVLLLERWLGRAQLESLAEQRLLLAARQMHSLLDHIKALTEDAPGYVVCTYQDAYPGDDDAEAETVLVSPYVHSTVAIAQRVAQGVQGRANRPVFALVPVVT